MASKNSASSRIAIYVSNADDGDISVLHFDARTTELTTVQRAQAGGVIMPLALSPDRCFLYAARRSDPFAVLSFAIDEHTGTLSLLGDSALPQSMASIATDRSGRFLFSASYGGNLIAVSAIDPRGIVQPAHQTMPTEPKAHAIVAAASNRHVFATSLGGGIVMQLRFDAETGRLSPNIVPALVPHAGASPRHVVFSPDGRFAYVLGELDGAIDVLAYDSQTGTLRTLQTTSSLPPGFAGEPWGADVHITPDGRFLYSSERRSHTLAAFGIDASTGCLALLGHTVTETQPRGFHVDASGRFLFAVGQLSNHLCVYEIDDDGALAAIQRCTVGRNPNWVETKTLA